MSRGEPLASTPVHAALRTAASALQAEGIESARLDAELLLAEVLGCGRAKLLAALREPLDEAHLNRFDGLIERRVRREPIAYLLGSAWFHGLEFEVSPAVLIPRPETELLVEWALSWIDGRPGPLQVIDVGTGSGAIALTVAHVLRNGDRGTQSDPSRALKPVSIFASDISKDALRVARANARRLELESSVEFIEADLLPTAPARFDLVLANLPYIGWDDRDRVMTDVDRYEPHVALYSGPDGLDHFDRLIGRLRGRLTGSAALALEIGDRQGRVLTERLAQAFPEADLEVHQDLAGLDRLVTVDVSGTDTGKTQGAEHRHSKERQQPSPARSGSPDA